MMKRVMLAAAALMVLGGTAASAQPFGGYDRQGRYDRYDRYDRHDRYDRRSYDRRGYDQRGYDRRDFRRDRWIRGAYLPPAYFRGGYYVDYRRHRGLRRPPSGYNWVRVDNDYILAALATGLILEVVRGY